MNPSDLNTVSKGSIVQISPTSKDFPYFKGCLLVVTEIQHWGVVGYVTIPDDERGDSGQAYLRASWEEIEPTGGVAPWQIGNEQD